MSNDEKIERRKRWGCEIGAASELRAATDLLLRGWHVFRSVSSTAPCDLIILKHGGMLRVEVKTAHEQVRYRRVKEGGIEQKYDVFAVIEADGRVTYTPNLDALDGW